MNGASKRAGELRRMAEDLIRIADELDPDPSRSREALWASWDNPNPWNDRAIAMAAYRARRERDRFFPERIFFEPSWDMLLDLFIADSDGKKIAITSLAIASAVPQATALRYMTTLIELDLAVRTRDPADSRRSIISITPSGRRAMSDYLRSLHVTLFNGATDLTVIEGDRAEPGTAQQERAPDENC